MAPLSLRGIDPRVPSNRVVCGSCEWRSESHREPQCKKDTSTRCLLYGLHYACDVQRVCWLTWSPTLDTSCSGPCYCVQLKLDRLLRWVGITWLDRLRRLCSGTRI